MRGTVRLLRVVQWAMLSSILLYAGAGELLGKRAKVADPALAYGISTASVAIVGVIFVLRRTLVLRSAQSLVSNPEDPIALQHWRTGYLATYALCEALALFGFVQRVMGFNLQQCVPYYLGGFVLLLFFGPREPARSDIDKAA